MIQLGIFYNLQTLIFNFLLRKCNYSSQVLGIFGFDTLEVSECLESENKKLLRSSTFDEE